MKPEISVFMAIKNVFMSFSRHFHGIFMKKRFIVLRNDVFLYAGVYCSSPFNQFRFLGAKLVQFHLSISIQMVSTERFNSDKSGTDIRVTGFFKSKSNTQILDLQGFTATKQASFSYLQGFSRAKPSPNFQFTGFLRSQAKPSFFRFTEFLKSKARPPFAIYRVLQRQASTAFQRF